MKTKRICLNYVSLWNSKVDEDSGLNVTPQTV